MEEGEMKRRGRDEKRERWKEGEMKSGRDEKRER